MPSLSTSSHLGSLEGRSPVTVKDLQAKKNRGEPIVATTCYDYSMARIIDQTAVDFVLVGDSLGSVMLGYSSTIPVTMDHMLVFSAAVSSGLTRALCVSDMPFLSYQASLSVAFENARHLMQKGGAQALKIEGSSEIALSTVRAFVDAGICVMGHLGYTPQSKHRFGKQYLQATTAEDGDVLVRQAQALEEAGVFSVVLEMVPTEIAAKVAKALSVPVIGIGAGARVDGQILVLQDLLGMNPSFKPRFLKTFGSVYDNIEEALHRYVGEVKEGVFPGKEQSFFTKDFPS
ncbi:MAG: 3-methyl-2-oxobutanoate hydroxymethyltransferase [Proteobacteria bacterium]|nr:3-methyl-2-oxobutanoate hydroxymethyltransferase [Pseudomonadota bacterium]